MNNYKALLTRINTFIFDYDGVLTDGSVLITSNGDALRSGNVKDGYAIQLALKKGYHVAVISGGNSLSMEKRMEMLKVNDYYLGVEKKMEVYNKYLAKHKLSQENVLYVGDDIPDIPVMQQAGVSVCPADAAEEVKKIATYISHFNGGKGCVRDVIEQVLKVQGKWMNDDAFHW
ncbi:MAG: HAD-IIIA family hydrolase [Lentimicrobiaceae bacterium]|nr:HAD-IIIA family hydrolase [Lentimicrobiaceae bacterium]